MKREIKVQSHDVLIQHLRIRVGDSETGPSPSNRDAIQVLGTGAYNVVIDHCSCSWAVDENVSTWYSLHDVTFSNNIVSEGLYNSIHSEGPHSMGLLVGDSATNITVTGNLLAHNWERNPRVNGNASVVVVNNVFYNAGPYEFAAVGNSTGATDASFVGNIYKTGPDTTATTAMKVVSTAYAGTEFYYDDNIATDLTMFSYSCGFNPVVEAPPIWWTGLTTRDSSTVMSWVSGNAGAWPASRDSVDARIVTDVRNGTGSIIDSQTEVGGWPTYAENTRDFDTYIPASPNDDDDSDGYTNIEEVLHAFAAEVEGIGDPPSGPTGEMPSLRVGNFTGNFN